LRHKSNKFSLKDKEDPSRRTGTDKVSITKPPMRKSSYTDQTSVTCC